MPSGHILHSLRWRLGEGVILKYIVSRPFNYAEQKSFLKILIRCVLGIDGLGGEGCWLPPNQFWLLENSLFNFQSNEPFMKFLRQQITIAKFLSDILQKNAKCVWEGVRPPITLNLIRVLKLPLINLMSPFRSLISLFLYKLYNPEGCGEGCHHQRYNFRIF